MMEKRRHGKHPIRAVDRTCFAPGPLARLEEAELATIEKQLRAILGML